MQNFLILGGVDTYVYLFIIPIIFLCLSMLIIGLIMIIDDLRGQPVGKKIISLFNNNHASANKVNTE